MTTGNRHEAIGNSKQAKVLGFALSAMLFVLCYSVEAQQPAKVPRIGFLLASSPGRDPRIEGFRQGLRELAYVEGKNIAIEWRYAEGNEELVPKLAAELVQLNVEIIVTDGTNVTRAAKNATKTIPIVMASDADPVGNGFVASLARPGGNVTGLVNLLADLSGKRLELLKEAIPGILRVGILWNPENPSSVSGFKETQEAARALAMQLQSLEVRSADDFAGAFQAATKAKARALTVVSDSLMFSNRRRLLGTCQQKQAANDAHSESVGGCRRDDVLRNKPSSPIPSRGRLRGQNPEGSQARRLTRRATDEVRVRNQFKIRKADRCDDSAERAGEGG